MQDFISGWMYFLLGMRYLFASGLKRFVILPILFNLIIFVTLFFFIYHSLFSYSQYFVNYLPNWLHFLGSVLLIILSICYFLLFLSMFTVLFNIVAAPFNGLLAEKTQEMFFNAPIPSLPFSTIAWRSIKRQGKFLLYFLPRLLVMVLLFFIPFIHPIYPILWFIFNAWMLSVQYQDFVMDNNAVDFSSMLAEMKQRRMRTLGFGTFINLISFIPVINIVTMPAGVIGSVFMYGHTNKFTLTKPVARLSHLKNGL